MAKIKHTRGYIYKLVLFAFGCLIIFNTFASRPCFSGSRGNAIACRSKYIHSVNQPPKPLTLLLFESEEGEEDDDLTTAKKFFSQADCTCILFFKQYLTVFPGRLNGSCNSISFTALPRHIVLQVFRI